MLIQSIRDSYKTAEIEYFIYLFSLLLMIIIAILLFSCIFSTSIAYTLEGNWTLTAVHSQSFSIASTIDKFIFRSSLIMNRLTFYTCNSLFYQISIDEENFWVNVDSQLIDTESKCSDNDIAIAQSIRQAIRSILTFDIFADKLYLYNPSEEPVMVFSRTKTNGLNKIFLNGTWIIKLEGDSESNYNFTVGPQTINACDGAVYKYIVTLPYSIKLEIQSGTCGKQVTQSLSKIAYFKKYNESISFFDSKVSPIASGIITAGSDLTQANTISNVPLFTLSTQPLKPKQILSASLASGNYILLLLYRRDLMRVKIQITSSTIQLKICSKLIFKYILGQSSQITITSTDTPNRQCKTADESIYFNYITGSSTYKVEQDGLITLIDSSSKSIVSLVPQ